MARSPKIDDVISAADAPVLLKVSVRDALQHDGDFYDPGELLELPVQQAMALVECGAVELIAA